MTIQELRDKGAKTGTRVRYIPMHAHDEKYHPDCEDGAISSFNDINVFVKFDAKVARLGWDQSTSECCDPETLVLL